MNLFVDNRKQFLDTMEDYSLLVLFSGHAVYKSADAFYSYWPQRNFFYFTGMTEPDQIYTALKKDGIVKETLWIQNRKPQLTRWLGELISKEQASTVSGLDDIRYQEDFDTFLGLILTSGTISIIHTIFQRRSLQMNIQKEEEFSRLILDKYPYIQFKNIAPTLHRQRTIKKPFEIEAIKKAIEITNDGLMNILKHLKPGCFEHTMEAYFDFTLRKHGVKFHAFPTIAASGKNATTLHYEDNCSPLQSGNLLLLDLGAQWDLYNADISRTYPINGTFSPEQRDLYRVVLQANKDVISHIKPGLPFASLQKICIDTLSSGLIDLGIITDKEELSEYYFHGVSHFLGLDTHDVGDTSGTLEPGMIFTVEPGLYFRDKEIGIRIEDDVCVTESGCDVLSAAIPKEMNEIEDLMSLHE